MSNSEEDEYCGADYETLDQWTARHIEEGRAKWGRGNCFDWLNPGAHCFGCHYNHPQLTLAVTGLVVEARPKRLAPWCRALEAMKFKYQGNDTWRHTTITPIEAVHGLLRKGVKRDHFDLVGEGFKQIKGPGANRLGNVCADSEDAFDDEAALALVAAAEEAEAAKAKDDVIDWDAVGAAADAARAEHDAKRARVL